MQETVGLDSSPKVLLWQSRLSPSRAAREGAALMGGERMENNLEIRYRHSFLPGRALGWNPNHAKNFVVNSVRRTPDVSPARKDAA